MSASKEDTVLQGGRATSTRAIGSVKAEVKGRGQQVGSGRDRVYQWERSSRENRSIQNPREPSLGGRDQRWCLRAGQETSSQKESQVDGNKTILVVYNFF